MNGVTDSGRIEEDLVKSGLKVSDINARVLGPSEKAATNTSFQVMGYVIPYFTIEGKPASFYRVRLFDHDPKYKQLKETPNHVYFPKGFKALADKSPYILITEGEKKAALACKMGFACVAFGGVDSWRNRQISIPAASEMAQSSAKIAVKLPAGEEVIENYMAPLALGMQDLIDYAMRVEKTLIIVYDTDDENGTGSEVQRAAAALGFELRFRGIAFDRIRQIILPSMSLKDGKTGLDDFLMHSQAGKEAMDTLIQRCLDKRTAFPRYPNIRDYLNKRLQKSKMSRKEMQAVAIAVLSELDSEGMRLKSGGNGNSYYFERKTHKLLKASFKRAADDLSDSPFGQYLYRNYGIGSADNRLVQWLGTLFTGEPPIADTTPHRVIARTKFEDDNVILQVSDGEFVTVDADGVKFHLNGDNGILFEAGHVGKVDIVKLRDEWKRQSAEPHIYSWWYKVLNDVRLKDKDKKRIIISLLYYIAPFLYRWRGTQLPIEMTLGEAGSGKSTLQELRLMILTGEAQLRNSAKDLPGWHASVSNSGGLHITDNVQLLNKDLRQQLSDEICRLITEPYPTIEMRKYYTESDLVRLPVRCVFGITSIAQPFQNADILQRAVIVELEKPVEEGKAVMYDMAWKQRQLEAYGGREAWLAHHLVVLNRFFQLVKTEWNPQYQAKHRLVNFEQILMLLAKLFKFDSDWIPGYLVGLTENAITESDWIFEGLVAFSFYWRASNPTKKFTTQEIANWSLGMPEYEKCEMLINSRRLGKFLKTHRSMVASITGILEDGMVNNRTRYKAVHVTK